MAGVLGVVPGVMGLLQATEAIKVLLHLGDPLVGRLLIWDALDGTFSEVTLRRDPHCPACGDGTLAASEPSEAAPHICGRRVTSVRIPPVLRVHVSGEKEVDASGADRRRGAQRSRGALPGPRGAAAHR